MIGEWYSCLGNTPPSIPVKPDDFRHPHDLRELGFSVEETGLIEQWAYEYSQREIISRKLAYHFYSYAAFRMASSVREELEKFIQRYYGARV